MNDRRPQSGRCNLMLTVVCLLAGAGLACAGSPRKPAGGSGGVATDTGGATTGTGGVSNGGTSGQGGVTGSGGATGGTTATGGVLGGGGSGPISSGGSGGASATGGTTADASVPVEGGQGGGIDAPAGGTGGTTPPLTCTTDTDCPSGDKCRSGICTKPCNDSLDCASADLVCDKSHGWCVQCAKDTDCADGQTCVATQCVSAAKCQSAGDCGSGKVCDSSGHCAACAADGDCGSGQHCVESACRTACDTDKICTPLSMLCSPALSICVECSADKPCAAGTLCSSAGTCGPPVCVVGDSMCADNGVAECKADGSGWGPVTACPDSNPCKAYGGVAGCGGPAAPIDGGTQPPIDGGTDGPTATCTTATIDPCTTIPTFTGTQTVDGKDDEFCNIPSFVLNKADAKVVNNYNGIQDSEFSSISARVAWSSAGLHAFFDVTDSKVQSVTMADPSQALTSPYQGDSIELFISSNDTTTGAPGGDGGTVHVTLAATGKSALVTTTNTGGLSTAYAELAAAEYAQAMTTTGYAIEVLIPWKGGNPASGTKVRFDLALNMADSTFTSVADMRDAQIIYYVGTVGGQTSCPGAAEPYCDDRTWCSTTLQ